MTASPIYQTDFPTLKLVRRGKVRDLYDLGEYLLIVATDRLSAFDVVMPQPIPLKGKVLTQISNYWFSLVTDIIPNHLVATSVDDFPDECEKYRDVLRGRSVMVRKTKPLPIECVARGYVAGSGWNEYRVSGKICGIALPPGLRESDRIPRPIFTPATKAGEGHDENISFERAAETAGKDVAEAARATTLKIYERASEIALDRGIIIADTKMEFGIEHGRMILIDELLTPDSSRFWPKSGYAPGRAQESYDKQFVRDYLLSINFDKKPPGPALPDDIIEKTSDLYRQALILITGRDVEE
ncbi:MAG TPA: phosphoribosylaminoimidazolesuccinocarboxamide synthase [Bacteroidota bacterium]|nr:phosphoribosylaminoimidazolesuccinocarboxamide synthase [Bacteroidota bacterium]